MGAQIRVPTAAAQPDYLDELSAQTAPLPAVIAWLARQVGCKAVAVIGGVTSTRQVGEWMRGDREPRSIDSARRLRLAARLTSIIMESVEGTGWDRGAAFAWFTGSNRLLDDESPMLLVAHEDLDKPFGAASVQPNRRSFQTRERSLQKRLIEAARSFAALAG